MAQRNILRLLAVLLTLALLAAPVSASPGERLEVERQVFDYLTDELKLSNAAACGVLANIEHESAFQPTVFGDHGTSYGLCQWHNERFTALRSYCSALGLSYHTVEGQMAYLKYELGTNYTNLLLSLQAIDNTPDGAYRAAYLWCIQFEKPSNMMVKAVSRGELAEGKYWARYGDHEPITIILPQPEEPEPSPEFLVEQLMQHTVTIPLPPEEETKISGGVRHYVFQKPAFIYYIPRNLPKPAAEPSSDLAWGIPALTAIGAAMAAVVAFPVKKKPEAVYSGGQDVVK